MNIINLEHIHSNNKWSSIYDNLVLLDLHIPRQEMPGEKEKSLWITELENKFPGLIDYESGGLKKTPVSDGHGAFVALLVELVSCELQTLAGISSMFGEVSAIDGGEPRYRVIFSCEGKETGLYAARAAVEMVQYLVNGQPFEFSQYLERLVMLHHNTGRLETAA